MAVDESFKLDKKPSTTGGPETFCVLGKRLPYRFLPKAMYDPPGGGGGGGGGGRGVPVEQLVA